MKRFAVFVCIMLLAVIGTAMAQTTDVPKDHWAYNAVQELADKGYVTGYPDGTFMGNRALTRYEFATVVKRILDNVENKLTTQNNVPITAPATTTTETPAPTGMSAVDVTNLNKLVDEFKVELTVIGTRLDKVESEMADLQSRFGTVETIITDPEGAFESTKADVSKLKKITFSGYLQTRYENFVKSVDEDNKATNDSFNVRRARLKMTAKPTDFTTAVIQLDAAANKTGVKEAYLEYDFNGNPSSGPTLTVGQQLWPFGYEVTYSSAKRESPEMALWARRLFTGEYDRGLKVAYPVAKNWLLQAGVFDGTGIDTVNTLVVTDPTTTPFKTTKIGSTVAKDYDKNKDIVANLQYAGDSLEFGLSAYIGKNVWNADRTTTVTGVDKTRYGADFRYFLNDITIKGEYVRAKGVDTAPTYLKWLDAWDAQLNYNITQNDTLVAKYENMSIDPVNTKYGRRNAWNLGAIHWLDDKTRFKLFYQLNQEELAPVNNNIWRAEWIMTY